MARRYGETITLIAQLEREQVMVRLPAARDHLSSLDKSLIAEQQKFNDISGKQAEKQEKANELGEGSWYPGKYLLGKKKHQEKVGLQ